MTKEKLTRAKEVESQLDVLTRELARYHKAVRPEAIYNDYNIFLSEYRDGSGWSMNLSGGGVGAELQKLVVEFLTNKIVALEKEFEEL